MSSSDSSQVPRHLLDILHGRYEFLSLLGRGGSGTVYEVRNIQLDRVEALKVLINTMSEETTMRFAQEARVSASLDHPGVVRVYDFGHTEDINWYSMQLIEGPSLSTMIDSGVRLNSSGFSRLTIPLLDALAYSHNKGVIHRDIKPANIMLHKNGYPCITDFGIAKSPDTADLTQTGNMMGTPAYMAPEQAEGKKVDGRSDQYSMAITLYRAVSGRLPFSSTGPVETLIQRLKEDPEPLDWHCPDFPAPLKNVLMKALSRNRDDRFADIEQMLAAMKAACETCNIQWNKPLEGFEHLSVSAKTPIDTHGYSYSEGAEMTAASRTSRRSQKKPQSLILVFGSLVVAAILFGVWHLSKPMADQLGLPSGQSQQDEWKDSTETTPTPNSGNSEAAKPASSAKPAAAPAKEPPPPAFRKAITHPLLKDENRSGSISIPPESAGKDVAVRVKVGEDGRVTECIILTANLSDEEKRIVKAIALNMIFLPAKAEDGSPVASDAIAGITL
jgi:serine/threonine-protein kinase